MKPITATDASAFQSSPVTTAVDPAVAVKPTDSQPQAEGGVLELLSAAMAVIEAATTPLPDVGHAVDTVA